MDTHEAALPGRPGLRLRVILTGALLAIAALTVVAGLLPYYRQLNTACNGTGFCFPPALFAHDVAVLAGYGVPLQLYAAFFFALQLIINIGYLSLAGILFWRRRNDSMALCTAAVLAMQTLGPSGVISALIDPTGPGLWLLYATALGAKLLIILFLAIFPSGRIEPLALRRALPLLALVVIAATIAEALNPLEPAVRFGVYTVEAIWMVALLLAQRHRYLYISNPDERRQTRGLMMLLALYVSFTIGFIWYIGTVGSPDGRFTLLRTLLFVLQYLLELALIFGVVIALRRGLYNLERIAGRTVVYALLTACILALYVLIVGGVSLLVQPAGNTFVALLAVGIVAAAVQPLRTALQRGVNQLIYGQRDEPYQVLELLGRRLGGALAPQDMLPGVAAAIRDALRLPYVAVTRDDWDGELVLSAGGEPTDSAVAFPLIVQHEQIGRLIVAPRTSEEPFTTRERRLLTTLAQHISIAVHAVRLTDDLQRSRERLVVAREEERRRLQRDLHDELGPTLASMSMQLDVARTQLWDDPAAGEVLLAEVQSQLREAIGTVRQIVHQLRPPILDQLGLCGAVSESAMRIERGAGVRVRLELPAALPPMSAAVEAAAYYIVAEALNNMARHARARNCTVRLCVGTRLQIEVADDGVGLPVQINAGIGLRSMRERALEVGGVWEITGAPAGGTIICAGLPLTL